MWIERKRKCRLCGKRASWLYNEGTYNFEDGFCTECFNKVREIVYRFIGGDIHIKDNNQIMKDGLNYLVEHPWILMVIF